MAVFRSYSPVILASSSTAVAHTGDTSEAALATILVPANTLGANGRLIGTSIWSWTSNSNNKTIKHRFGTGSNGLGVTNIGQIVMTTTGGARFEMEVGSANSTSAQMVCWNTTGFGVVVPGTNAADTTVNNYFSWTGTLATGTDTITLLSYRLVFWPGV